MTTNLIPRPEALYLESPVSWNTRYLTPEGFECQLTLRGESGQEVLEKANTAMAYLLSNGCSPVTSHHSSNGNHTTTPSNGGDHGSWCPIHNVEMKRWEKNGRIWFSHKDGDGWCSGKPKRS